MAGKKKESAIDPHKWEDVPEIPKEEQPYPLPEGWKWVKLGELTQIIGGGTPSTTHKEYFENGDIPWITPADLSEYSDIYISHGKRNISKKGLENSSARLLPKDSVCLTTRAPIGYVCIAENELCTNQGFKSFLPTESYLSSYLYWYLKGNKDLLDTFASGTTFLEISGTRAKEIPLPLPPLETQQRIVTRIESLFSKLDEAAEKVQSVIDSHEARKQAILHMAFSGELTRGVEIEEDDYYKDIPEISKKNHPYPIPEGWKWVKIGDILNLKAGKNITSKYISSTMSTDYKYPCFGGNGIRGYVREFNHNGKYYIIGRQGALCGNINLAIGKFYATEHAVVVDKKIHNLDIDYVGMYLRYMNLNQYATATAQPGLAVNNIVKLPFLLPPQKIQKYIVHHSELLFNNFDKVKKIIITFMNNLHIIKQTILNKAFKGGLTNGF